MSKKKSGRPLFDEHGHRIGHVDDAHHEPHPSNTGRRVLVLCIVVFGLGYGLATDRGQAIAAQVWHELKQGAEPSPAP